jgi:mRNA interferase MazF
MTGYSRGDIILVGLVFSDESGTKLRPALVVSSSHYQRARREMIVSAITSNVERRLYGDHPISDWKGAGLLSPSIGTSIVRTIKQLSESDMNAVDNELRRCLGI